LFTSLFGMSIWFVCIHTFDLRYLIMHNALTLILYVGYFLVMPVSGMAVWMTKEECKKTMRVGELIMGSEATLSTLREVQVYRDGALVASGGTYIPGEELLVSLVGPDDTGVQFVFEASNAVFIGGGCDGRRVANSKAAKLLLPSDTSPDAPQVHIISGWATGYTTVQITPTFVLIPVSATAIPLDDSVESSNGKEGANVKVVPNDPPQAPIGVISKFEDTDRSVREEASPGKTHLRTQPKELDLPQTLPSDHKIKMKPKSPSAFTRTHPQMTVTNSKLPAETKEENEPTDKADPAVTEDRFKSAPLSTKPTEAAEVKPILPSKHTVEPESREDAKIEDVMESMDQFAEQVQQHRAPLKAVNTHKAPLKSPSKRNKFMDSWHTKTRKEKMTMKLAVGDVKNVGDGESGVEKQASNPGAVQGEQLHKDGEVHAEDLPGAELSATEKRLRRSVGK